MPRLYFAVPGGLDLHTGGAIYDRRVTEALRADGWWVEVLDWPGTFPFPSEDQRLEAAASLAALPDGALALIDGLALGTLPGLARREAERLRLVGLVHHPLALETGLSPMMAATFAAEERDALEAVRGAIVTSQTTAAILEGAFGVPAAKIAVAPPGVDKPPPAARFAYGAERPPGPVRILSLGAVTPRKAHHVLVDALALVRDLDWTCVVAGSLERDPETAGALADRIAALGLEGRVRLLGEVDDAQVARLYRQAEVFALASVYEGYGMALAEAQAHGLAIVATTGGAIPEAVYPGAGLLVPPGEAEPFAEALRTLVSDKVRRDTMRFVSQEEGLKLPEWTDTAALVGAALERF